MPRNSLKINELRAFFFHKSIQKNRHFAAAQNLAIDVFEHRRGERVADIIGFDRKSFVRPVDQNGDFDLFRQRFEERFYGKKKRSARVRHVIDDDDGAATKRIFFEVDGDIGGRRIGGRKAQPGQNEPRLGRANGPQFGQNHLREAVPVVVEASENDLRLAQISFEDFDGESPNFLADLPLVEDFHAPIFLVGRHQKLFKFAADRLFQRQKKPKTAVFKPNRLFRKMIQSLVFAAVLAVVSYFGYKGFARVYRNIRLGKAEKLTGDTSQRWRNVALVAFGQKKMFANWIPAVFHLFIYVAFLFTQIELIEIIIDGLFGQHRFFAQFLGGFYNVIISTIEILSLLAFVATIIFLLRRNVLNVARFKKPELSGFPMRDANVILGLEIILIIGIFSMNGADNLLQKMGADHYKMTGGFAVSSWLGPAIFGGFSEAKLIAVERFGWWLHALTVFGFVLYLPFSKHLHVFLAFPAVFFAKLTQKGQLSNMPEIQKEVRLMMGLDQPAADETPSSEMPVFGADDVFSLTQNNLLQAYSCTECGRCTAACPANQTGKKLSPRKVMMDVRDRMETVGKNIDAGLFSIENYNDEKNLFDLISREELHACTTCNACVEACPIMLNPLDIIVQLRRHEILTQSAGPAEWLPMFNAIENGGAAWAMSQERDAWRHEN